MPHSLYDFINAIPPLDNSLAPVAQAHLDNLTKPVRSLGRLEELAVRLFCIQGGQRPLKADPARIYTIAGDHGVFAEGVSPFPQEVTRQMVQNFLDDGAGINVLCNTVGCELYVVDAGSCGGTYPEHPRLIQRKIHPGTANLSQGPAMPREHCEQAVMLGIELARMACDAGCHTVGTGEMGISNTTSATALYCAYLKLDPTDITGPGAGIPPETVAHKANIIRTALGVNATVVESGHTLDILAALGGYELAALTGLILGGAYYRMAILLDGFISTAAWLAAWRLCPTVAEYSFFSHTSAEPGHTAALQHMGIRPLHDLGLRLGEGSGAALTLFLLRSAAAIFNDMATFSSADVSLATSRAYTR